LRSQITDMDQTRSVRAQRSQEVNFGENISHGSVPLPSDLKKNLEDVLQLLQTMFIEVDSAGEAVQKALSLRAFAQWIGWFVEGNVAHLADFFNIGRERRAFLLRHFMRNHFQTFKLSYSDVEGNLWTHVKHLARKGYSWAPESCAPDDFDEIEQISVDFISEEALPDDFAGRFLEALVPMYISADIDISWMGPPAALSFSSAIRHGLLKRVLPTDKRSSTSYLNAPERRSLSKGGAMLLLLPEIVSKRSGDALQPPAIFLSLDDIAECSEGERFVGRSSPRHLGDFLGVTALFASQSAPSTSIPGGEPSLPGSNGSNRPLAGSTDESTSARQEYS